MLGFMPTPISQLRGGVAYPRTRVEFDAFFPDDPACLDYLQKLRWPQGFVCPECGSTGSPWQMARGLLLGSDCRKQTSVIAGTLFHRTRTPMRQWLMAAWEITCQKYGASALGLQRVLGLGSYKTAWAWLHKFRRAMVLPGRDPLCGIVEVDETYVGAEEADVVGRRTLTKAMVVVAVEVNDGRIGRVRLRSVPDLKGKTLTGFVADVVAPGTTVRTDGLRAYGGLAKKGFVHDVTVIGQSSSPAHVEMPAVHRGVPLVKRWLLGTLQGGVSREHLPYYLDEYTFRFNRRTSQVIVLPPVGASGPDCTDADIQALPGHRARAPAAAAKSQPLTPQHPVVG